MSVRVRFAPSPTGFLHIGGARTALFNWLYARHTGGALILRIEDTDAARNSAEAVNVILDGLRWLGLEWDEGPVDGSPSGPAKGDRGPYFQSQRSAIYRARVQELLDKDLAYEHEGAIRFRMERKPVTIPDLIVGDVTRELTDREQANPDFVIVRSDGQPVFHLVNVVDDLEMGITHVIRGEDHLSNTPKHIALFRAFDAAPPLYGHIPLILNSDGTKMSKRDQGASLAAYQDEGYAPEGVVNYLCLLGWSPKDDRQVLPLAEVVERFDLSQVLRHNARFDLQKLQWISWEHIKAMSAERFDELACPFLERAGIPAKNSEPAFRRAALETCREKIKTFADLPNFAGFYFTDLVAVDPEAARQIFTSEGLERLRQTREAYAPLEPFTAETTQAALKATATRLGVKAAALVHPLRLACTGKTVGPSLYHLLEALGKERVLKRIDQALAAD